MCDVCSEFLDLLQSYEEKISKESDERPVLQKDEVETVVLYIQSWSQRQCMCCFRDSKNYERFNLITQSIICLAVCQLKELREDLVKVKPPEKTEKKTVGDSSNSSSKDEGNKQNECDSVSVDTAPEAVPGTASSKAGEGDQADDTDHAKADQDCKDKKKKNNKKRDKCEDKQGSEGTGDEEEWSLQEKEKLLHFLSKVFLLNYPLYVAYKHTMQSKLEEITQQEAGSLNVFCDLHDPEIPVYLLRNVCLFCRSGGVHAMTYCFEHQSPDTLPVSLAHAMIAIVCNLKLWLNFRSIMQLFVPLRSKVLRYMCSLADKDLRTPGIKTMAESRRYNRSNKYGGNAVLQPVHGLRDGNPINGLTFSWPATSWKDIKLLSSLTKGTAGLNNVTRNTRVCSAHFKKDDYETTLLGDRS